MSIKIAVEVSGKSFLPEAHVYKKRFLSLGFECDIVPKNGYISGGYDAVVLFHGFHPFWKKYPRFIIGEYHSLSVGRFSRVKDLIKRILNVKADFLVFLNKDVRNLMWFSESDNHVLRGMGFYPSARKSKSFQSREFDVVYCGSERAGVVREVEKLARLNLKVAVVGFCSDRDIENVKFFGRLSSKDAADVVHNSRFGLNYTPDVFPFNIQDSTKVIEYCGAGIGVITNRYYWVDEFERRWNGKFISLDSITHSSDIFDSDYVVPDVSELEWDVVVDSVFEKISVKLTEALNKSQNQR